MERYGSPSLIQGKGPHMIHGRIRFENENESDMARPCFSTGIPHP